MVVLNLVLALDSIPSESRWTNTLPNVKKTSVRKVLFNLGLLPFINAEGIGLDADVRFSDDAAAHAAYLQQVSGVRARKAKEYFSRPKTFHELGVLVAVLDSADRLLFAMLGGVDRTAPQCKLNRLRDHDASLVGEV